MFSRYSTCCGLPKCVYVATPHTAYSLLQLKCVFCIQLMTTLQRCKSAVYGVSFTLHISACRSAAGLMISYVCANYFNPRATSPISIGNTLHGRFKHCFMKHQYSGRKLNMNCFKSPSYTLQRKYIRESITLFQIHKFMLTWYRCLALLIVFSYSVSWRPLWFGIFLQNFKMYSWKHFQLTNQEKKSALNRTKCFLIVGHVIGNDFDHFPS
jgi:hypothetical protein